MAENRFHELLGLPEEVTDPDYYQLLGVVRTEKDAALIETRFKERMTRVQHIENPRHKEFLEFLKGELKRARGILTDEARRAAYDRELSEERVQELRKVLSHMLVDGTLSSVAEISVITEGQNLGLEGTFIRQVVDEELKRAGARRVSANTNGQEQQAALNRKAQEVARQEQQARMAARIAEQRARMAESQMKAAEVQVQAVAAKARELHNRAKIAETDRRKAEQQVQAVARKARDAEAIARKAVTREHLAAAKVQMSEQERKKLEERFAEAEGKMQAFAEAAREEAEALREHGLKWNRLALCYASLCAALVAGAALPSMAPGAAESVRTRL
ncbi:MAG: hypothetical protein HUU15_07000, partial [Candidatus Brocadiae bacterium]|nr:hypothetical protein [Candidatus Brocadiia bacterium]